MDRYFHENTPPIMALTAELVKLCDRVELDPGPNPQFTPIEPAELDALTETLLNELGSQKLWLFAYGSLIWKPNFNFVTQRRGTIHGWHRSFCLELTTWRGTPQLPGLMLALDHGGRCDGVVYQLPEGEHREHIRRLVGREISAKEDLAMVRWVKVHTASGPIHALVFWAGPKGEGISLKLPLERVAWVLARACGHGGSCASYLYNTVLHLEELGIRDRNLWKLQELLADEILTSVRPALRMAAKGLRSAPGPKRKCRFLPPAVANKARADGGSTKFRRSSVPHVVDYSPRLFPGE